jgi:hypothetical protein
MKRTAIFMFALLALATGGGRRRCDRQMEGNLETDDESRELTFDLKTDGAN